MESDAAYLAAFEAALRASFGPPASFDSSTVDDEGRALALAAVLDARPLAAFIPARYGGRGTRVRECLAILELAGYASLPLALMLGIAGALFIEPVAKYGHEAVKAELFPRLLDQRELAGLMLTEPGHGSDALNIQTEFVGCGGGYRLRGVKHWAGLTGQAQAWLIAARERGPTGRLGLAPGLFVCDPSAPGQDIVVEQRYPNLGLRPIPYGRSRIEVELPAHARLRSDRGDLSMLRDFLHRTRLQFPGLAIGFVRRLLDEAVRHCRARRVGGRALIDYDLVRARIARMQAAVTVISALCVYASEHAGLERELASDAIVPSAVKACVTDLMHASAQSLVQLVGAQAYRLDHIAGRALIDSRAFQIFEGSNDLLYKSIGEVVVRAMVLGRERDLAGFLRDSGLGPRACELLGQRIALGVERDLAQRKLWALGQLVSRVVVLEQLVELGERGYEPERVAAAEPCLVAEIEALLPQLHTTRLPEPVIHDDPPPTWSACTRA